MENNPLSPVYYNYPLKNFLIKDFNCFSEPNNYLKINLCLYTINTSGKLPFIQYLLSNNGVKTLSLPVLPIYNSFSKNNLKEYSKVYLSSILQATNFEEFNKNIEFDGFYEFKQNLYLFFDVSYYKINIDDTYSSSPIRFALIDEILNHRNICNIPIHPEITEFFIKNESINFLYDEKNEAYEIPIVGYVGKSTPEKTNFGLIFGVSVNDKSAILGPYYYFTDFCHAIRQGGWSSNYKPEYFFNKLITDNENGRYEKGGIIRFALFTGRTKYIENMPNSVIDKSEIKKQRLDDPTLNQTYEKMTLRISDHDGEWSKTYDSVYLGIIELDDGSLLQEVPSIVLREYNQQIPLSCHYIDKHTIGEKFNANNDSYKIV